MNRTTPPTNGKGDETEQPVKGEVRWARWLYRNVAWCYDALRPLWTVGRAETELDRLLAHHVRSNSRVLDLGCGTGFNLSRMYRQSAGFDRYLGVDVSERMLRRARQRARSLVESHPRDPDDPSRVQFRNADVAALTAADLAPLGGQPDVIVCTWLLSHFERPERIVESAIGLLTPGGSAFFLYFTRPHSALVRLPVAVFVKLYGGQFVDPSALEALPAFHSQVNTLSGTATLSWFEVTREASDHDG